MSHPIVRDLSDGPDWARRIFVGMTVALVAGTLWYFWWTDHLRERCASLGYASVLGVPPRPSEMAWYQEHCWEGRPR